MKAAVIQSYGDADKVFEYVDWIEQPNIGADDILIRIKASSVNPIDCLARTGYGRRFFIKKRGFEFPLILGNDLSGVVERVGSRVQKFNIGDEVFAAPDATGHGSYAEYRVTKAEYCVKKPSQCSHIEAASIPYVATTAWIALVDKAGLNSNIAQGKKVLIHGGSGGIGSFAIQLLKAWGAYVATTCSTAKVERVKLLGADQVIDYQRQDFTAELHDFDLVLDTVGGDCEAKSQKVLKKKSDASFKPCYVSLITPVLGNIDQYGLLAGLVRSIVTLLGKKRQSKKEGIRYEWALFKPNSHALEEVKTLIEQDKIKTLIDRVFSLPDIVDAHRYVESGNVLGKVVIEVK